VCALSARCTVCIECNYVACFAPHVRSGGRHTARACALYLHLVLLWPLCYDSVLLCCMRSNGILFPVSLGSFSRLIFAPSSPAFALHLLVRSTRSWGLTLLFKPRCGIHFIICGSWACACILAGRAFSWRSKVRPGTKHIYHSGDTMIATSAMSK
jgi:hypothetical protein